MLTHVKTKNGRWVRIETADLAKTFIPARNPDGSKADRALGGDESRRVSDLIYRGDIVAGDLPTPDPPAVATLRQLVAVGADALLILDRLPAAFRPDNDWMQHALGVVGECVTTLNEYAAPAARRG